MNGFADEIIPCVPALLKDHLGTVRVTVNDEGDVIGYADYSPFGQQIAPRTNASGSVTKENFTGHELDGETGLLYAGARYYDPALGRWMSPDPLADEFPGWSPYNYTLNNPVRLVDPDGRAPTECPRCDIMQDHRAYARLGMTKPRPSPGQVATATDVALRTFVEPYDWARIGIDWATGNGSAWDAAALLPFVSGATDDVARRGMALLEGAPGVNVAARSDATGYRYNISGGRSGAGTPLTDMQAVEDVIGHLSSGPRMAVSGDQAVALEKALGLPSGRLAKGGVISIVSDVAARAPRSPLSGNDLFLGGGQGLPGGGPEINVAPINTAGGGGIRQIILDIE